KRGPQEPMGPARLRQGTDDFPVAEWIEVPAPGRPEGGAGEAYGGTRSFDGGGGFEERRRRGMGGELGGGGGLRGRPRGVQGGGGGGARTGGADTGRAPRSGARGARGDRRANRG